MSLLHEAYEENYTRKWPVTRVSEVDAASCLDWEECKHALRVGLNAQGRPKGPSARYAVRVRCCEQTQLIERFYRAAYVSKLAGSEREGLAARSRETQ